MGLDNLDCFSAEKVFMHVDAIDVEHGIAEADTIVAKRELNERLADRIRGCGVELLLG